MTVNDEDLKQEGKIRSTGTRDDEQLATHYSQYTHRLKEV